MTDAIDREQSLRIVGRQLCSSGDPTKRQRCSTIMELGALPSVPTPDVSPVPPTRENFCDDCGRFCTEKYLSAEHKCQRCQRIDEPCEFMPEPRGAFGIAQGWCRTHDVGWIWCEHAKTVSAPPVAPSVGELEWREITQPVNGRARWFVSGLPWLIDANEYFEDAAPQHVRQNFVIKAADDEQRVSLARTDTLVAAKSLANSLQRILSGAAEPTP